MTLLITIIIAVVALVVGYLLGKVQYQQALLRIEQEGQVQCVQKDADIAALQKELTSTYTHMDHLIKQAEEHHQAMLAKVEEQHAAELQAAEVRLDTLRQQQSEDRKAWQEQVLQLAEQLAHQESDRLRTANRQQMDELLQPLGQSIQEFREKYVAGQATTQNVVQQLMERTQSIGAEAQALTQALRGNSKKQGNWGEGILENLLQSSGLTAGRDYDTQYSVKGYQGQQLFPDVVVHLPDHSCIVLDAKVSLNAFVDYHAATTREEEEQALKAHLKSVDTHVKELSAKQYPKYVEGAIGFVLMFIPNEAAYLAAVQADAHLMQRAYEQRVIIINPSNLLMTLQLAYHLNQAQQRQHNVDTMFEEARKVYDKFVSLAQSFNKLENHLKGSMEMFMKAKSQLSTGRGNIKDRLEGWKALGLTPSKQLDKKQQQQLEQPLEDYEQMIFDPSVQPAADDHDAQEAGSTII